jgi:hypothetical protein
MTLLKALFSRSGGTWLFGWSFVYFWFAMYDVFYEQTDWFPWIQFAWLVVCALPLFVPPLARFLRMKPLWK